MDWIALIKTVVIFAVLVAAIILFFKQRRNPSVKLRRAAIVTAIVFFVLAGFSRLNSGYAFYDINVYQRITGGCRILYSLDGTSSRFIVTSDGHVGTVSLEEAKSGVINIKHINCDAEESAEFSENDTNAFVDIYRSADGSDCFVRICGSFNPAAEISDNCGSVFLEERNELKQDANERFFILGDYAALIRGFDKENYILTIGDTEVSFE